MNAEFCFVLLKAKLVANVDIAVAGVQKLVANVDIAITGTQRKAFCQLDSRGI